MQKLLNMEANKRINLGEFKSLIRKVDGSVSEDDMLYLYQRAVDAEFGDQHLSLKSVQSLLFSHHVGGFGKHLFFQYSK